MHLRSATHSEKELKNKNIANATYLALFVSINLSILKFYNYYQTELLFIKASAIDSLMDIMVSFANYIAIRLVLKDKNNKFPIGYDKIASFITFLQVCFVSWLSVLVINDSIDKLLNLNSISVESIGIEQAAYVTIYALFLNTILVFYQTYVIKKTGSIIIKADRTHYTSDFFSNFSLLLGLFLIKNFNMHWVDPVFTILFSIYLLFSLGELFIISIKSLLDMNNLKEHSEILKILIKNNLILQPNQLQVFFSGVNFRIRVIKEIQNKNEVKVILNNCYPDCVIEFIN